MSALEREDGFCPHCHVSYDLHPYVDYEDEWPCEIAKKKADLLERFGGMFA